MSEVFNEIIQPPTNFLRKLTQKQQKMLREFDNYNERRNLRRNTRVRQIKTIGHLGDDVKKEFQDMTKEDVNNWLYNKDIIPHSRQTYQQYLQKFFKWLDKDIEGWFEKIENAYDKVIPPSALWTREDVNKLINSYPETQHRALVATLYDSEARVSEICSMNIMDVEFIADVCVIYIRESKTQKRRIELLFATKELIPWYNIRKQNAEPSDPLWLSKCNRDRNSRLTQGGVYEILKYGQRLSGVDKHLHPHLLRHSMASYLRKRGFPDALHKKRMGLKPTSTVLERYTHLSDSEVAEGAREAFGGEPIRKRKQESNPLISVKCPRCGASVRQTDKVCHQCFYTINYEVVTEDISVFEIFKTNFGKSEKQKILSCFKSLKTVVPLLQELFSCFNGTDERDIEKLREHFNLELDDDQLLELLGILIGRELVEIDGSKVVLLDRQMMEREIDDHLKLIKIS